jgi:hypothetical protein
MSEDEENKQAPSQPLYQHSPTHPSRPNFSSKCPVLSGAKLEQLQKDLGDASTISLRPKAPSKSLETNRSGPVVKSAFDLSEEALPIE